MTMTVAATTITASNVETVESVGDSKHVAHAARHWRHEPGYWRMSWCIDEELAARVLLCRVATAPA